MKECALSFIYLITNTVNLGVGSHNFDTNFVKLMVNLFSNDSETCEAAKILLTHASTISKDAVFNLVSVDYKARLEPDILSACER